ncbi:AMP-dependent synthetase/ligase [Nocardiopsis alba]|uniref:AMP-dependent synthetase/ligase n=1 Tax=Nocardiopsis alba TaxID=53437 RepID=UPI003818ACC9
MTLPPGTANDLTLVDLLRRNAREHPDLPALSGPSRDGRGRTTLTWERVHTTVTSLAAGLIDLGIRPGDRALLMMGNRPEHWLADLALLHAGAVPGSVYSTSAPEQIAHIARHGRARLAVVENPTVAAVWEPLLRDPATPLEFLVVVDGPDLERGHLSYEDLVGSPDTRGTEGLHEPGPDDLATVIHTSGTTGAPKGVAITHRAVLAQAIALDRSVGVPGHPDHVCYLPPAHIAERVLGLYLPLLRASHVWMCPELADLPATLARVRPPHFLGVPRVWEKLAVAVRLVMAGLSEDERAAVDAARRIATERLAHVERGDAVPEELEEGYRRARAEVLTPLLAGLGLDRLILAAGASAPLPPDLVRFWAGLGVVIMDAWGLTESVGVATMNVPSPGGFRLGSVGRPLPGIELRTGEDGEVFLRGDSLFEGYLREDGTIDPAVDDEGWFATGDVGRVDEDGFLWITDRKKELIVTSGGKNVSPALVENALKEHPLIGQAFVHGDGRPYPVALLVLDPEVTPVWAVSRGVDPGPDPAGHPEIVAEVERAVEAANARLSRPERVKRHRLLAGEWGPGSGELTPSLKIRRRVVAERYAGEIDALYEE